MGRFINVVSGLFLAALLFLPSTAAGAEKPQRRITPLGSDVYRFTEDRHSSVFMVTSEGVMVTDPLKRVRRDG